MFRPKPHTEEVLDFCDDRIFMKNAMAWALNGITVIFSILELKQI